MANANQNESSREPTLLSVRIQCSGIIADQLSEALLCFGASSVSVEDASSGEPLEEGISYDPVPWEPQKRQFWSQSCVTALFSAEQDVGECLALAVDSIGLKEIPKYEIIEKEGHEWLQQVQDMFHPVQINDSVWIIPEWRTPPDPLATNIILDPGLAFGTGEHPTTKLCLSFICESINGGEHVLDYGTGSGILGIAALKMGAAKAVGIDTDPMAVQSAKHNATLNSFGPDKMGVYLVSDDGSNSLSSRTPSERIAEWPLETATSGTVPAQYDIVVANILMNPLLQLAAHITGYVKPGGHVGLSGITIDQVTVVEQCYSQFLESILVSEADGWACIKGRKKELP